MLTVIDFHRSPDSAIPCCSSDNISMHHGYYLLPE